MLDVWKDGSGGLYDLDGSLRTSLLACLQDEQLGVDDLVEVERSSTNGTSATADGPSNVTQTLNWVVTGGWRILLAISVALCAALGAAVYCITRVLAKEAPATFIGLLPMSVSLGTRDKLWPYSTPFRQLRHQLKRAKAKAQPSPPVAALRTHQPASKEKPRRAREHQETASASQSAGQGVFDYDAELRAAGLDLDPMQEARMPAMRMTPMTPLQLPTDAVPRLAKPPMSQAPLDATPSPGTASSSTALLPQSSFGLPAARSELHQPGSQTGANAMLVPLGRSQLKQEASSSSESGEIHESDEGEEEAELLTDRYRTAPPHVRGSTWGRSHVAKPPPMPVMPPPPSVIGHSRMLQADAAGGSGSDSDRSSDGETRPLTIREKLLAHAKVAAKKSSMSLPSSPRASSPAKSKWEDMEEDMDNHVQDDDNRPFLTEPWSGFTSIGARGFGPGMRSQSGARSRDASGSRDGSRSGTSRATSRASSRSASVKSFPSIRSGRSAKSTASAALKRSGSMSRV